MNLTNKHIALLITLFISATVVLGMFTFHIKKQSEHIAESYYELESEDPKKDKEPDTEDVTSSPKAGEKAETNQAFNETKQYKKFAQAYKLIEPPKDYVPSKSSANNTQTSQSDYLINSSENAINEDEMSSFNKANDILKKQLQDDSANLKSTMSYSLKKRRLLNNPTPIYLCEEGGKIVVNITVNASGKVTEAYINNASTSSNECLKEHAIEYAKKALFNSVSGNTEQLGSITFLFQGKH